MAHLCPALPRHLAVNAGQYAELELLQTLERGLSNAYTLFHSVDWSRGAGMIVNDESKTWMQPIMNFRDQYLTLDDRHFRDFRRLNGRITLTDYDDKVKTPDRLIHGPYTQDRRETLSRELLTLKPLLTY